MPAPCINRLIFTPTYWTPANIKTRVWFDAADATTITESGGRVSQWNDKSGNANNATQGIGADQPTTGTTTINSLNTFQCVNTGNNDMDFDSPITFTDFTLFWVGQADTDAMTNSGSTAKTIIGENGNDNYIGTIHYDETSGFIRCRSEDDSGTLYVSEFSGVTSVTSPFIMSQRSETGVNSLGYFNGTAGSTTSALGSTTVTRILDGYQFAKPFDGKFGELILCDSALSESARQKVEGYLAHKWGLTANLPALHPYKNASPTV